MADESTTQHAGLLSLPPELLQMTFRHLLNVEHVALRPDDAGIVYDFDLALLRVNRQLRDEARQALRGNDLIQVVYFGEPENAPGCLFPSASRNDDGVDLTSLKIATVCMGVGSRTYGLPSPTWIRETGLMTLAVFEQYSYYLAATRRDAERALDHFHWEMVQSSASSAEASGAVHFSEKRLNDARARIQAIVKDMLPPPGTDREQMYRRRLGLQSDRKALLDNVLRSGFWKDRPWAGQFVTAYRSLCDSLQFIAAAERTTTRDSERWSPGIWKLMAATFCTFTSLYYHPALEEAPPLPALLCEAICKEDVCPCAMFAAQGQPYLSIMARLLQVSPLPVSTLLWAKIDAQIALIHMVLYKEDDELEKNLPHLLFRLTQTRSSLECAGLPADPALEGDIAAVQAALQSGLHPADGTDEGELGQKWYILWRRTSLQRGALDIVSNDATEIETCWDYQAVDLPEHEFLRCNCT